MNDGATASQDSSRAEHDIRIRRKESGYVTIAHVFDPRFGHCLKSEDDVLKSVFASFEEEMKRQKIDILFITGGEIGGTAQNVQNYRHAQGSIGSMCATWELDADRCVRWVAGARDMALTSAALADQKALNAGLERDAIESLKRMSDEPSLVTRLVFSHAKGVEIGLRVMSVGQAAGDPNGSVSQQPDFPKALAVLKGELFKPSKMTEENGEDFNICLMANFPLALTDEDLAGLSDVERHDVISGTFESLTAAAGVTPLPRKDLASDGNSLDNYRGNLVNSAMFMTSAITHGVNLLLHGHPSGPFFKAIDHPDARRSDRMIVAGAGSLSRLADSRCRYNLIRLHNTGNIEVEHDAIVVGMTNLPQHEVERRHVLMDEYRLRIHRFECRQRQLLRRPLLPKTPASGSRASATESDQATCTSMTRIFRLDNSGGADVVMSINGLKPIGQSLEKIRLMVTNANGAFDKPSCKAWMTENDMQLVGGNPLKARIDSQPASDTEQKTIIFLRLSQPLTSGETANVSISYKLSRAFELFATPESNLWETIYFRCNAVFPEHLRLVAIFPPEAAPENNPKAEVGDECDREDRAETRYATNRLIYLKEEGIATLTIDRPLPGLFYGLRWLKRRRLTVSARGARGGKVKVQRKASQRKSRPPSY